MRSPARQFAVGCALVVPVLFAYANSFGSGFPLDNKALILEDARVHAATRENLDLILNHSYWWPIGESGLYRPLTTLSYLFNYAVLGNRDRPFGYHLVNLTLHIVNVLLVYALTLRVTRLDTPERSIDRQQQTRSWKKQPPRTPSSQSELLSAPSARSAVAFYSLPMGVAALWAVHPLSTEAVTNIVGRADLMAAAAVLGGLLLYIKSTDTSGRRLFWLAALAAVTAVGVFAKESAVVIAPIVALFALCDHRHVGARRRRAPTLMALVAIGPPLLLLWYQRARVLGAAPPPEFPLVDNPIAAAGFWNGRLTALTVLGRYLRLALWPDRLSADYSYAQIPLATGGVEDWIAWIAVVGVFIATIALWRRDRTAFFFAAFALITFLPASNLLFATGTIMAERVMYLPSVGVTALVVMAIEAPSRASSESNVAQAFRPATAALKRCATVAPVLVVCAIVAGCGIRTWNRNNDWRSDLTLWSAALEASPRSFKAHRALAEALYETDATHANIARVVDEIDKSVAILQPLPDGLNDAKTYRQAAAYHLEQGDLAANRAQNDRGAGSQPAASFTAPAQSLRAYDTSMSLLLRCLAIIDAARGPSTAAPRADAYRLLSAVYVRLGAADKAVDAAARARELEPLNVVGYRQATAALLAAERGDDAAVMLMVGSMVTGDRTLRDELVDLYRSGLDREGCAVVASASGTALNPSCGTIRRHMCAATKEAIEIHQRTGRLDQAERLSESARRQFGCR